MPIARLAAAALILGSTLSLASPVTQVSRTGGAATRSSVTHIAAAGGRTGAAGAESSAHANGAEVFRRVCAACHVSIVQASAQGSAKALDSRAIPQELLKSFPPDAILNALTTGKMQAQGSSLSDADRRAVSEFVSGRTFEQAKASSTEKPNPCTDGLTMRDPASGPSWNGWGNGPRNTRFQDKAQGGLTAADLPRLQLKWAYGYPNVSSTRAQPSVAGGRLFIASENGEVRALNAKTGCTYWTFKSQAGVSSSPVVGAYRSADGKSGFAVYFGDRKANAYAVDAQSGHLVWTRRVDDHKLAGITGSFTYFGGRVFVPVQGIAEESLGSHNDYPCCTFRGNVSALDASTGAVVWKTYTVGENHPRGKTQNGIESFGPAGGSIWSAPTVDAKRHLVYVGTGNGFADPPQPMTDAVIALDLETGAVKWAHQAKAGDDWAMGCNASNPGNPVCPQSLGPDYDFSAPPALAHLAGRDLIVLPQKAAIAWALDPDTGTVVWKFPFGKGSGLGGQWGTAIEGGRAYFGVADMMTPHPGGVQAITLATGKPAWRMPPQPKLCGEAIGCNAGQGGPLTAIPGAVLSAAMDGGLRAYSIKDGSILWTFNANREFDTVNGLKAHGGSMDNAGPVVAGGMLYVNSGYGGLLGIAGNVLLAFGPED